MKILVFGTKSYDRESFEKELADYPDLKVDFTETNLTPLTATLAQGYDAVCAFVNANVGAMTLEVLRGLGVGLVLMRCAGFDAVDVNAAKDLGITVAENKSEEDEEVYTEEVTEDDNEEYGDVNNYIVLEETEIEDYINNADY